MSERTITVGTLTFAVYNESRDKQHVNAEIFADGNASAGNLDCSLREWHALQDAIADRKRLEAENASLHSALAAERASVALLESQVFELQRLFVSAEADYQCASTERDAARQECGRMRAVLIETRGFLNGLAKTRMSIGLADKLLDEAKVIDDALTAHGKEGE